MPNVVGQIPDFADEGTQEVPIVTDEGTEGVIKAPETGEEKETLTELPAEAEEPQKPADEIGEDTGQPDINSAVERATEGLRNEIVDLRKKLAEASGAKRDIVEKQLFQAEQKLDDLQDVSPEDVSVIERVLKSKGYVKKEEVQAEFYDRVKQQKLNTFLDKYPELKPENDPSDLNWSALQRELGFYRMPEDPNRIDEVLERAYRNIKPATGGQGTEVPAKKRQIEVAGVGSGGTQRPSSGGKTLDPRYREELLRGGWSEEDIKNIEIKLT